MHFYLILRCPPGIPESQMYSDASDCHYPRRVNFSLKLCSTSRRWAYPVSSPVKRGFPPRSQYVCLCGIFIGTSKLKRRLCPIGFLLSVHIFAHSVLLTYNTKQNFSEAERSRWNALRLVILYTPTKSQLVDGALAVRAAHAARGSTSAYCHCLNVFTYPADIPTYFCPVQTLRLKDGWPSTNLAGRRGSLAGLLSLQLLHPHPRAGAPRTLG